MKEGSVNAAAKLRGVSARVLFQADTVRGGLLQKVLDGSHSPVLVAGFMAWQDHFEVGKRNSEFYTHGGFRRVGFGYSLDGGGITRDCWEAVWMREGHRFLDLTFPGMHHSLHECT